MKSPLYTKLRLDLLRAMVAYTGGLIGLIVALLYLRHQKSKFAPAPGSCQLS